MPSPVRRTDSYWPRDEQLDVLETTVGGLLRDAAAAVPDRLALVDGTPDPTARRSWTYAELLRVAEAVARALLKRFEPGERVAVWAPNCPEWMLLQQGASLAGVVLVTMNPAYRSHEAEFVLRQSEAAGVFFADEYRGFDMAAAVQAARAGAPRLRETVSFSRWDEFVASGDPGAPLPDVAPSDAVQIQYTSGTTGFPKGAVLHHRGVVNASRFVALTAGAPDGVVWINAMPMFHVGGGAVTELGCLSRRGTYVLMPGYDAGLMLELIETYRGQMTLVVPTMLIGMLDHPDAKTRDVSSLVTVLTGAAAVPAALVRRTKAEFGCDTSIMFGQTELNGVVTMAAPQDSPEDQAETVGRPLPQAEVKIADPETGQILPIGERGEICVRGYQTMTEYFGMPEETVRTLRDGGWLHMGDLGTMDDRGYLRITGRLKDMIIRGGENIYPAEVEDVLFSHPDIAEVAVVGVPDERWGEEVGAVIRLRDPATEPSTEEMRAYCRERLASFKAPSRWYFVDALPATPSGKVQKFVLRDRIGDGSLVPSAISRSSGQAAESSELAQA